MEDKYKTQDITIRMETLTPLWTGGVESHMDSLHQTGIIGSLRWWYEAMVRGLGHSACDPTSHESEETCPVCSLFGQTGEKRKFIINIDSSGEMLWDSPHYNLNIRPYGRRRGWFLPPGFVGTLDLRLYGESNSVDQVASLIQWLSRWGSIGAKSQLGYGVIRVLETSTTIKPINCGLLGGIELNRPYENFPDLRTFTFFRFQFTPDDKQWWKTMRDFQYLMKDGNNARIIENLARKDMIPVSPLLKNYFRYRKDWKSAGIPKWLFGTIEGDKRHKSKVHFSWAYRVQDHWEVRGWAWLPYGARSRYFYNDALQGLKAAIEDKTEWLKALDIQGKVSQAKIHTEPVESTWGVKNAGSVMKWLEEVTA
jgi:CRISPR-associated protein Cmr1